MGKTFRFLPADVRLFEVRPHADGLPVELIGLLQPRLVRSDQIGQVYVHVEMVRRHTRRILLTGNDLINGEQSSRLSHTYEVLTTLILVQDGHQLLLLNQ